ncbi:hypothetical protein [Asticcacaulis sp.]|jgi:hypothetical protein|uniref:hypothetical protein n=1 Tax=Asticcacaulis sp. TaxID=1872648 RepID=UPI00391C9258
MPFNDRFKIEVVVDVDDTYARYEVTPVDGCNPVMELSIAHDKSLSVVFYPSHEAVRIPLQDMEEICGAFKKFAPLAIANGDAARDYFKSLG